MKMLGLVHRTPSRVSLIVALIAAAFVLCGAGRALGAVTWSLTSLSNTTAAPGSTVSYLLEVRNVGDTDTDGTDVNVTVTLPPGLEGVSAVPSTNVDFVVCPDISGLQTFTCTGPAFLSAFSLRQTIEIVARVGESAAGVLTASFVIDGGGAPSAAQTVDPLTISETPAGFGIDGFDGNVTDARGGTLSQAGRRPANLATWIDFNTFTDPRPILGSRRPVEDVKDISVDLPPGLVGGVSGLDECTTLQLGNGSASLPTPLCPATSQVGTTTIRHSTGTIGPVPVFNMVRPPDVPARFGFNVFGVIVVLDAQVARSAGQYHVRVRGSNISQGLALVGSSFDFWGVPSDASHDTERACPGRPNPASGGPSCRSGAPRAALFRNPTSCTGSVGLETRATIDSWQNPGDERQATFLSHIAPGYPFAPVDWGPQQGTENCDRVPFTPVLRAQPISGVKAGKPAGFTFDIEVPQDNLPQSAGQADVRTVAVTLPQGVRLTPSSANGLGSCNSEQIALESIDPPRCPDSSKLGTVSIETPLLDEPVKGNAYLATPFDNPFKSLVSMYIVASARGVVLKLPGLVSLDPDTGQITTTFDNNPQLPFSRLHLELFGGPLAAVVPRRCATYTTHAELTGWNGRTVTSESSFTLSENARGRPCPPQFFPGFSAGTESNRAGGASSFLLRFTREDEDQEFRSVTVKMPRGLTGKIANADLCSDAQVSGDACPSNSKIGDVVTGAGAGSSPFFITNGRAYLTGPYKGAPFGVAIVVPAVAGPFDLGKVTVRSALFVDEKTAQVSIVSDPFPTILKGIPLDVRDVRVNVNKRDFFLNPTSCATKTIEGTLTSTEGVRANVSDRFQAADCASLGFKPSMTIRVGGRGHTRRGRTTPFSTTLRMPQRNQANLRFVRVTLPRTINARLTVINDACTRTEFEHDVARCAHAKAGTAVASTPLLRRALRGNVYFVKNGNPIPDLFVALRGQVDFDLVGRVTIPGSTRLRTTFATAPDVPIRSFSLRLLGDAKNGSVGAAANLCSRASRRQKVAVDYIGQNGAVRQVEQALNVGGCRRQTRSRGR